jgi:hypothetical protein
MIVMLKPSSPAKPPALDSATEEERHAVKCLRNEAGWWEGDENALRVLREWSRGERPKRHMPRHVGLFLQMADELEEMARQEPNTPEAESIKCGLRMAAALARKKQKLVTNSL